jgi:hypothetical protein
MYTRYEQRRREKPQQYERISPYNSDGGRDFGVSWLANA